MASPFSIVTALVDQIDFTGEILSDTDIRISGKIKLLWILKVFVIIILQLFWLYWEWKFSLYFVKGWDLVLNTSTSPN